MYKDSILDPWHSPENFEYSRFPFSLVDFGFTNLKATNINDMQLQNCPISLMDYDDGLTFCHFQPPSFAAVTLPDLGLLCPPGEPFQLTLDSDSTSYPFPCFYFQNFSVFALEVRFLQAPYSLFWFLSRCALSVSMMAFGSFVFNTPASRAVLPLPGCCLLSICFTYCIFPLLSFLGNTDKDLLIF